MLKRLLALSLVLMITLAGCGQSGTGSSAPASTPEESEAPVESTPAEEGSEPAAAIDFPTKPVEATVQWAAGGGADLVFRALADVFPKYANGQTLVIKNVDGASGVTGCAEFLSATPDGYQIMHWSNAHVSKIHMSEVPYDIDSYEPVIQVVESANYLLVQADAKWNSIEEFIADALENPGEITIANAGVGGGNHLAALLFEDAIGAEFAHISYSGGGPSVTGLISGEVDAAMCNSPEGMTNVDAGQVKILTTLGSERFENYPDVPTIQESGVDLVVEQWRGIAVPLGTPEEVIQALHDIFKSCLEDDAYIDTIKSMGAVPRYRDREDFRAFAEEENERFLNLISSKGFGDIYGS